jgi:TrmH family RNA methyltransferase
MHPGNIGSAARAMKTMGLADLRLVAPAQVHANLVEAIGDCQSAFALSARTREWSTPVLDARAAAAEAARLAGPVAFVFGNEEAGLTNEEMLACQYLVHIPSDPQYSSLNLAQAVQVVSYEVFLNSGKREKPDMRLEKPATVADREGLYAHLEQAGIESEFYKPASGSKLPTRLRRLFSRIPDLEREEVNILRGLLNALQEPRSK